MFASGAWLASASWQILGLFCAIMLVLVVELLNSGIEAAVDRTGLEINEYAKLGQGLWFCRSDAEPGYRWINLVLHPFGLAADEMTDKVYVTPEGARRLRDELNQLWRVTRPEVTKNVSDAAALGDRSENADYIYGKKRLREIDKRIRYLTKRLDNLEIVDRTPEATDTIYFGAWVKVEDEDGEISELRIVGSDEFDPALGWISLDSPMAKSLLGKKKDTSVLVNLPAGQSELFIVDVSYTPLNAS